MCYAFQTIHAYENAKFTDNSNKIRPYFEHDSTTQREKEQNKKNTPLFSNYLSSLLLPVSALSLHKSFLIIVYIYLVW